MIKFTLIITLLAAGTWATPIQQQVSKGTRVIGGQPATAGQFPWQAGIIVTGAVHDFCSGALISRQHVLTAAQCVSGASFFVVHLGTISFNPADEQLSRVVVATSLATAHEGYNDLTLENDVAVISFHMAVTLSDYIQTVGISADVYPPGTAVQIAGWGQTDPMIPGRVNYLEYVDLVTISNQECQVVYGTFVKDSMVCAAGNNDEGFCTGDSGASLITPDPHSRQHFIVGVASFLHPNGCNIPPSGYTRISSHYDWIQALIAP